MRDSVVDGLSVTRHLDAKACTVARSELSFSAASVGFSIMRFRLVSSAKSLIPTLMFSTMSLIYTKKSKGPKSEPWGDTSVNLSPIRCNSW